MKSNLNNNLNYKNLNKIKALIINISLLLSAVFNNKKFNIFFTWLNFMKKAKKWLLILLINY